MGEVTTSAAGVEGSPAHQAGVTPTSGPRDRADPRGGESGPYFGMTQRKSVFVCKERVRREVPGLSNFFFFILKLAAFLI